MFTVAKATDILRELGVVGKHGDRVAKRHHKSMSPTQEAGLPNSAIPAPLFCSVNIFSRRMNGNVYKPLNY